MMDLREYDYEADSRSVLGFWTYLMTDCVLFASLFAVFAVLRTHTFGGPGPHQLFDLSFVLVETLILLTSSLTCGLAVLAARNNVRVLTVVNLAATALLGIAFIYLELGEFGRLAASGAGPDRSAFLSAYFTLVGTHGLHVSLGIVWASALIVAILARGLRRGEMRKLLLLALFWHFLDIIWILIFTFVYLMSAL